jgi:hypothetical protein
MIPISITLGWDVQRRSFPATIVSGDDPPVPLGPNTSQTCLLLVPNWSTLEPPLRRSDGKQVHFYTVTPLYTEERNFEVKHGIEEFLKRFADTKTLMTVDVNRPNVGL